MLAPAIPDFDAKTIIESKTHADINHCWTCNSCDIECPVNKATNRLRPQKIIRLANLGFVDELLSLPEIWYCLECKRCDYVCPNRVKPSTVICYLREETLRRNFVSMKATQQRRILFAKFQRVRWHTVEHCLNGEIRSIDESQWYDWLETPIDNRGGIIPLSDIVASETLRNVSNDSSIYSCFNCRECSNACPVSSGPGVFDPLWIFHLVHLGLEEEILKSPSIWLCIACKRCTETCSQLVGGHLIIQRLQKMALQEGVVDRGFLYRWHKAQKIIYPRFIKEVDALFMNSRVSGIDINKKNVELHPSRKTIIVNGFSEPYVIKKAQRPKEERPTVCLPIASAG